MPSVIEFGCGHWGKDRALNFSDIGTLSAIADVDHEMAAICGQMYNVQAMTSEQAFESDVDTVVIAAPAEHHAPQALRVRRVLDAYSLPKA